MAENLFIPESGTRAEIYEQLIPQIRSLLTGEQDLIANMANISAAIKMTFNFLWTGFYIVKNDALVLGPFQGPIACTRIKKGKGVCGTAWLEKKIVIVPDVDKFPGHIACSSESKSEIVLPGILNGEVIFVLDIDSSRLNDFNQTDEEYLDQVVQILIGSLTTDKNK